MRRNTRDAPAAASLPLRKKSKLASYAGIALLSSVMIGGFAAPARSDVDVHLGFGVPSYYYPYPYPRTYYDGPYYSYYDAYPRHSYRRSWEPGHWERRYDRRLDRHVRVWVPGHYRY